MQNEKRLIDANALMEVIKFEHDCIMQDPEVGKNMKWCEAVCNHRVTEAIERSPTVDAVEVVHGRWKKQVEDGMYWYECSECGGEVPKTRYKHDWYSACCPNCGAKMDGDGNA